MKTNSHLLSFSQSGYIRECHSLIFGRQRIAQGEFRLAHAGEHVGKAGRIDLQTMKLLIMGYGMVGEKSMTNLPFHCETSTGA
jgi:hypothetical protein